MNKYQLIKKELEDKNGILRLKPVWVFGEVIPSGNRLKDMIKNSNANKDNICERFLGSTIGLGNNDNLYDYGISMIIIDNDKEISLKEAIKIAGPLMVGKNYKKYSNGLMRLAKILDYGVRIPYHYHQTSEDARMVGMNGKDEAYYFLEGIDAGKQPETFIGVHPYIARKKKYEKLLHYIEEWNSDLILSLSKAYKQIPGEGFLVPAGVLHAPGTALTLEIQEESIVFSFLQAEIDGKIIPQDYIFKYIDKNQINKFGKKVVLKQINWKINGDPYYYEKYNLKPKLIEKSIQDGGEEFWIFYNTKKFSGKKLIVKPGHFYVSIDSGFYNIFVWRGRGSFGGIEINAGDSEYDELFISDSASTKPIIIKNSGKEEMCIFKFFSPGINTFIKNN